ncbi:MAG TPA: hypothetical protein VLT36_11050 [Candidatus Dormibacteraeota bacterium]|nr:hypothetical protein [Candidatus Dormibacteraeota bacterium]
MGQRLHISTPTISWTGTILLLVILSTGAMRGAEFEKFFAQGTTAYRAGNYTNAAAAFAESASLQPASGTLQNLGNAEWRAGQAGAAILAWERSLWLDPFNRAAHNNLRFARKALQVESPDLGWFEVISTWLPVSWWAWIAGLSFWVAIAAALMPGILRWRKAGWHQAIAALGLTVFLLSLPAHAGVQTRARLGFVLQKDTGLRLTPTADAQDITKLAAGDPARLVRVRGDYLLVRTSRATGWLRTGEFGQVCP